jgi:moderate conductance mechanosensitive channel
MFESLLQYLPFSGADILKAGGVILTAFVIALFVNRIVGFLSERAIRRLIKPDHFLSKEAEEKRENTLIRIVRGTVRIVIWVLAILVALSELGINIGPFIAAAGIAGLALGFGGQYLIRDVIAGLFIILENQYRVGDVVCFDETCGLVEDINIRDVTLRDLDGVVHHVQHGNVKTVSNLSKGFARVNLNIGVDYATDLEHAISVINRVGNELAKDPAWKEAVVKPPQFLRVNEFGDSSIVLKILGETKPLKQWDVTGELRKRLKTAFDKEGIVIPFPQRVVHQTK